MAGIIAERFARVTSEYRHRIAIFGLSEDSTRTFAQLRDDIETLRRELLNLGLPPRPTIVSNIGNRTGFIALFVAGLQMSAAVVLIDGDAPIAEVLRTAATYGADLVVVPAGVTGINHRAPIQLPCALAAIAFQQPEAPAWRLPSETGGLLVKLTSGSTRAPKAVIATEENIVSDGEHVIEAMGITSKDVGLAAVPMAHSYGLGNLLLPLLLEGSPVVLRDRFLPAQWASDVVECGVTMFPAVPFIFDHLRRSGESADVITRLRLLVTAGAPIDFEILSHFKRQFGTKIHSLYGTSETGSIAFDSSEALYDPVSVGWPVPGTSVTLTPMSDLPVSEGRIRVQGSAVCQRYAHDDPVADHTSEFTPSGFLTADLGTMAADGRLTLLGRVSGFVNVAGRKVHPREVERTIAEMVGVAHVSVFGIESGARGQELVACVHRRHTDLSVAAIRKHCATVLSPFKVPRAVVFTDELAVDNRGKTIREAVETLLRTAERETEDL